MVLTTTSELNLLSYHCLWLFVLLLATLHDHMFMYLGLFVNSAVVFYVMFFSCFFMFYVGLLIVFYEWHCIIH